MAWWLKSLCSVRDELRALSLTMSTLCSSWLTRKVGWHGSGRNHSLVQCLADGKQGPVGWWEWQRSFGLQWLLRWVCLKIVYPYTQWLMIIIPTKWLFHWEYTIPNIFRHTQIVSDPSKRGPAVARLTAVVKMSEVVTWNDLGEEPPVMMQALVQVDGGLEGKTHFCFFFGWEKHTEFYSILRLMISEAWPFGAGYCSNEDLPRSLRQWASRLFNKSVGLKQV